MATLGSGLLSSSGPAKQVWLASGWCGRSCGTLVSVALLSGSVFIRPVRVALAMRPSLPLVREAVRQATSTWAGVHHLLVASDQPDEARDLARRARCDVIWAIDTDQASVELGRTAGFEWIAAGMDGPFEEPAPFRSARLLGPEVMPSPPTAFRVRPTWDDADPLADLFSVWFGEYGDTDYGRVLKAQFDAEAAIPHLGTDRQFERFNEWVTPLKDTVKEVQYSGLSVGPGFMLVDPSSPADLMTFWNLRALGDDVFPWPTHSADRLILAAEAWFSSLPARDPGRNVNLWLGQYEMPAMLQQLLESSDLTTWAGLGLSQHSAGTRHGHPLMTDFTRAFNITVPSDETWVPVGLPALPIMRQSPKQLETPRSVAAQVTIIRQDAMGPELTFITPNLGALGPILPGNGFPESFHRPTANGRAVGIDVDAETLTLGALGTWRVLAQILEPTGWKIAQSESGRFTARLIELLGGLRSQVGNQPAIRWILDTAARAPHGKPFGVLLESARKAQGEWPERLLASKEATKAYPVEAIYYLLKQKILRPLMPLKCPECASTDYLVPESLATDYTCDMCGKVNPLGYVSVKTSNTVSWCYRPASALTPERIAETLPVMACLNVIHRIMRQYAGTLPYRLGVTVADSRKSWSCEIDAMVLGDIRGAPAVVIGEVKSYRDSITEEDLVNLKLVQNRFREAGLDCVVFIGTLHESLNDGELSALRAFCEQAPADFVWPRSSAAPVMPLVLTAQDLSLPQTHPDHPASWLRGGELFDVAVESCRRNLGLRRWDPIVEPLVSGIKPTGWRLRWLSEEG